MGTLLKEKGWANEKKLSWGDAEFDFGRFPEGEDKEKTKHMGFGFYDKA